jgi:hypothetical protein
MVEPELAVSPELDLDATFSQTLIVCPTDEALGPKQSRRHRLDQESVDNAANQILDFPAGLEDGRKKVLQLVALRQDSEILRN